MKRSPIKRRPLQSWPALSIGALDLSYAICDWGECDDDGMGLRYEPTRETWVPVCAWHLEERPRFAPFRIKRRGEKLVRVAMRAAKPPKGGRVKRADALHSLVVRARDQTCQIAGFAGTECLGYLQCCHLISRDYRAVRWLEENAVTGCEKHHQWLDNRSREKEEFARQALGENEWSRLHQLAMTHEAEDPAAAINRLAPRLRGLS